MTNEQAAFYVSAGVDRALSEAARTGRDINVAGALYRKVNHGGPAHEPTPPTQEHSPEQAPDEREGAKLREETAVCERLYGGRHYFAIDGMCQRCGHDSATPPEPEQVPAGEVVAGEGEGL